MMSIQTHSPISVAQYILDKSSQNNNPLTPMQVIKLVYLCHGWMLGLHGRPLIDESIEAWRYGPVIRSLYNKVKEYKSSPISRVLDESLSKENFDELEKNTMDQVSDLYGNFSGPTLSSLTHMEGTPWSVVWNASGQNSTISNDLIEDHFSGLYRQYQDKKTA